jgi:hypothetical protein
VVAASTHQIEELAELFASPGASKTKVSGRP